GAGTALRDHNLDPAAKDEMINTVCEEAERLEHLVSNLLDMTRLDSGTIELKRDLVPLVEIVGGALTRLDAKLAEHTIKTDLPDDLPLVSADPVLMQPLLINVLENAAKYAPQGTSIEISARR